MADFAHWAIAAGPALGFTHQEFVEAYDANRRELRLVAVEASCATDVIEWFNDTKPMTRRVGGYKYGVEMTFKTVKRVRWTGTFKDLLSAVRQYPVSAPVASFPKSPKALQAEMDRAEPNLVEAGIQLKHLKREGRDRASSHRNRQKLRVRCSSNAEQPGESSPLESCASRAC